MTNESLIHYKLNFPRPPWKLVINLELYLQKLVEFVEFKIWSSFFTFTWIYS